MSTGGGAAEFRYTSTRDLSDVLATVEEILGRGALRSWRKQHEEWAPDGRWVYFDFTLQITPLVRLEPRSLLAQMATGIRAYHGETVDRAVPYRYTISIGLAQLPEGGSLISGALREEIDPENITFDDNRWSAPSMIDRIGDPARDIERAIRSAER